MQGKANARLERVLDTVEDQLLADIAIRVQLPRGKYKLAVERYQAMADWIDRPGSPLHGKVVIVYPQGSMSIGATIAARGGTDEFDLDVMVQVDLPGGMTPEEMLDILYEAIRGEEGSRYHSMTVRQTRCVTVQYSDNMHMDFAPALRLFSEPERVSVLAHHKPEVRGDDGYFFWANPYGFAEWFRENTPPEEGFAIAFAERSEEFEHQLGVILAAEAEDIPDQEPVERKSRAVVALQLLKRFRDRRFADREDRQPPSVVLSKLVADHANQTVSLLDELVIQARSLRDLLQSHNTSQTLLHIENPTCSNDILTDRWPADVADQRTFEADLNYLLVQLERLSGETNLAEKRAILADLFGEIPAEQAVRNYSEKVGVMIKSNTVRQRAIGGDIVLGKAVGISTALGVSTASHGTVVAPAKSFFGDPPQ